MDVKPLFSITMATYNRSHLLTRAIESVLRQSYRNFELIIVDDASTDSTEAISKSFNDSRIIYYKHEQNRGVLAARNKAFDLAKGHYTAILDDDDELLPEALDIAVNEFMKLSAEGVRMLWFDRLDFERKQRSGHVSVKEGYLNYEDLLCHRTQGDFWVVLERSLLGNSDRFDERLWGYEGYLWMRLNRRCKSYYVPKILYINHREHDTERMSRSIDKMKHLPRIALTNKAFFEEYGQEVKRLCPKVYGRRLGILGFYQILIGEKREGRKACLESFKYGVSFEALVIFLLSFVLGSNHIKWLISTFLNVQQRLKMSHGMI
jgi:glycosyltransferase involved in cell wall biosynthesis